MSKYSTEGIYLFLVRSRRSQNPITLRAIQDHFNIASVSTVVYHLKKLEDAGLIRRDFYRANGIRLKDMDADTARKLLRSL